MAQDAQRLAGQNPHPVHDMNGEQTAALFSLAVLAFAAFYLAYIFKYGPKP